MYVPATNRFEDRAAQIAFMREHPFATLVSVVDGVPFATQLPVTVRQLRERVSVRGHLARANPQAGALDGQPALVVFSGPHAYVSPAHYDAVQNVPTWNYVAVHAQGTACTMTVDDIAGHEALLAELIAAVDPGYQAHWDGLPERYRAGMLRGIVGFEVPVTRLEGKAKLSQNKTAAERTRIANALAASDDEAARETGRLMLEAAARTAR